MREGRILPSITVESVRPSWSAWAKDENMSMWLNNCSKEELLSIMQATRKIDGNYRRMKDSTILKKLINNEIAHYQIFEFIKDPPELLQLAAVKQSGYVIRYIVNPSKEVQLAAVRQNGDSIKYIKNPSEEIKLAAVKQNGWAIYYIKNPSEEIQLAAVNEDSSAIGYIKNPSEEIRLGAGIFNTN